MKRASIIILLLLAAAVFAVALFFVPRAEPSSADTELPDKPRQPATETREVAPPPTDSIASTPDTGSEAETTPPDPSPTTPPTPDLPLSRLSLAPDWSSLDAWQQTITRRDFLTLIEDVYTNSPQWRKWFHVGKSEVLVDTGMTDQRFRLAFADPGTERSSPSTWRSAAQLDPAPSDQPLAGVRIAIDPGHIGGRWAKIEERWFQLGNGTPVKEGDMTLLVAQLLRTRLEALGAEIFLVRDDTEPVTEVRPETLELESDASSSLAERLFYRTAEIRARAESINNVIRPDLTLCLHFNAQAWGNPDQPTLVDGNHFHLLMNGAYTDGELGLVDHRYWLLRRIVQGFHKEEAAVAAAVARAFARETDLPPYLYDANSSRANNVDGNPYLWARNLLANRLYDCPVLFLEPYIMNSKIDYARIQAGDYEGMRDVHGQPRPSIFREYADALTQGLAQYYRQARSESP